MSKSKAVHSRAGAEIIGALIEFRDALRSEVPIEKKFTVRTVELDIESGPYCPADVRKTRKILNVSQAIFAKFLGVDVKTVSSWEQGLKQPSPIACRFMDEIARSPAHWRKRLGQAITKKAAHGTKT